MTEKQRMGHSFKSNSMIHVLQQKLQDNYIYISEVWNLFQVWNFFKKIDFFNKNSVVLVP